MEISSYSLYVGSGITILAIAINLITGLMARHFNSAVYKLLSLSAGLLFLIASTLYLIAISISPSFVGVSIICLAQAINSFRGVKLKNDLVITGQLIARETIGLLLLQALVGLLFFTTQAELIFASLLFSLVMLTSTIYNLIKMHTKKQLDLSAELPTVSLLVPARNEDHVLDQALENLLMLKYPKLEIIVLDDCSHDRTPQIIKNYAHAGVRFVPGTMLPEGWTGKNHALQTLLNESSGDYLLFCDVDIRMSADAVDDMIQIALVNNLTMISVLPGRREFDFLANLVQPLIEFWYVAWPFKTAISGSCMMLKSKELNAINGFSDYRQSVAPEFLIAKRLKSQNHKLLNGAGYLQVTTRKRFSSIIDTQVRVLYPLLASSLTFSFLVVILVLLLFVILPIYALASLNMIYLFIVVIAVLTNLLITTIFNPKNWFLSIINLPFSAVFFIVVVIKSVVDYEFRSVEWKKREVCYPAIEVIPSLPKL